MPQRYEDVSSYYAPIPPPVAPVAAQSPVFTGSSGAEQAQAEAAASRRRAEARAAEERQAAREAEQARVEEQARQARAQAAYAAQRRGETSQPAQSVPSLGDAANPQGPSPAETRSRTGTNGASGTSSAYSAAQQQYQAEQQARVQAQQVAEARARAQQYYTPSYSGRSDAYGPQQHSYANPGSNTGSAYDPGRQATGGERRPGQIAPVDPIVSRALAAVNYYGSTVPPWIERQADRPLNALAGQPGQDEPLLREGMSRSLANLAPGYFGGEAQRIHRAYQQARQQSPDERGVNPPRQAAMGQTGVLTDMATLGATDPLTYLGLGAGAAGPRAAQAAHVLGDLAYPQNLLLNPALEGVARSLSPVARGLRSGVSRALDTLNSGASEQLGIIPDRLTQSINPATGRVRLSRAEADATVHPSWRGQPSPAAPERPLRPKSVPEAAPPLDLPPASTRPQRELPQGAGTAQPYRYGNIPERPYPRVVPSTDAVNISESAAGAGLDTLNRDWWKLENALQTETNPARRRMLQNQQAGITETMDKVGDTGWKPSVRDPATARARIYAPNLRTGEFMQEPRFWTRESQTNKRGIPSPFTPTRMTPEERAAIVPAHVPSDLAPGLLPPEVPTPRSVPELVPPAPGGLRTYYDAQGRQHTIPYAEPLSTVNRQGDVHPWRANPITDNQVDPRTFAVDLANLDQYDRRSYDPNLNPRQIDLGTLQEDSPYYSPPQYHQSGRLKGKQITGTGEERTVSQAQEQAARDAWTVWKGSQNQKQLWLNPEDGRLYRNWRPNAPGQLGDPRFIQQGRPQSPADIEANLAHNQQNRLAFNDLPDPLAQEDAANRANFSGKPYNKQGDYYEQFSDVAPVVLPSGLPRQPGDLPQGPFILGRQPVPPETARYFPELGRNTGSFSDNPAFYPELGDQTGSFSEVPARPRTGGLRRGPQSGPRNSIIAGDGTGMGGPPEFGDNAGNYGDHLPDVPEVDPGHSLMWTESLPDDPAWNRHLQDLRKQQGLPDYIHPYLDNSEGALGSMTDNTAARTDKNFPGYRSYQRGNLDNTPVDQRTLEMHPFERWNPQNALPNPDALNIARPGIAGLPGQASLPQSGIRQQAQQALGYLWRLAKGDLNTWVDLVHQRGLEQYLHYDANGNMTPRGFALTMGRNEGELRGRMSGLVNRETESYDPTGRFTGYTVEQLSADQKRMQDLKLLELENKLSPADQLEKNQIDLRMARAREAMVTLQEEDLRLRVERGRATRPGPLRRAMPILGGAAAVGGVAALGTYVGNQLYNQLGDARGNLSTTEERNFTQREALQYPGGGNQLAQDSEHRAGGLGRYIPGNQAYNFPRAEQQFLQSIGADASNLQARQDMRTLAQAIVSLKGDAQIGAAQQLQALIVQYPQIAPHIVWSNFGTETVGVQNVPSIYAGIRAPGPNPTPTPLPTATPGPQSVQAGLLIDQFVDPKTSPEDKLAIGNILKGMATANPGMSAQGTYYGPNDPALKAGARDLGNILQVTPYIPPTATPRLAWTPTSTPTLDDPVAGGQYKELTDPFKHMVYGEVPELARKENALFNWMATTDAGAAYRDRTDLKAFWNKANPDMSLRDWYESMGHIGPTPTPTQVPGAQAQPIGRAPGPASIAQPGGGMRSNDLGDRHPPDQITPPPVIPSKPPTVDPRYAVKPANPPGDPGSAGPPGSAAGPAGPGRDYWAPPRNGGSPWRMDPVTGAWHVWYGGAWIVPAKGQSFASGGPGAPDSAGASGPPDDYWSPPKSGKSLYRQDPVTGTWHTWFNNQWMVPPDSTGGPEAARSTPGRTIYDPPLGNESPIRKFPDGSWRSWTGTEWAMEAGGTAGAAGGFSGGYSGGHGGGGGNYRARTATPTLGSSRQVGGIWETYQGRNWVPQLNSTADLPQEARTLISLYLAGMAPAQSLDAMAMQYGVPTEKLLALFTATPRWQNLPTLPVRNRI